MKYYEIWFYYYGNEDSRTDYEKEYTFYLKTEKTIASDKEMIEELKKNFPKTEKFNVSQINYIPLEDYKHLSKWFEIDSEEFEYSCGVPA